jgi:hypothetical protein
MYIWCTRYFNLYLHFRQSNLSNVLGSRRHTFLPSNVIACSCWIVSTNVFSISFSSVQSTVVFLVFFFLCHWNFYWFNILIFEHFLHFNKLRTIHHPTPHQTTHWQGNHISFSFMLFWIVTSTTLITISSLL